MLFRSTTRSELLIFLSIETEQYHAKFFASVIVITSHKFTGFYDVVQVARVQVHYEYD